MFFISYFRSGNHEALWRRIERVCDTAFATSVVSDTMKTWDIRVLRPLGANPAEDPAADARRGVARRREEGLIETVRVALKFVAACRGSGLMGRRVQT